MEKLVEWWLAGETEVLGENMPQCHFVHHKPHMLCPDVNPGLRGGKPATNLLNYGTTLYVSKSNTWWWLNEPKYVVKNVEYMVYLYFLLWWRSKFKKFHKHNMTLKYNISNGLPIIKYAFLQFPTQFFKR
jgi:hypothetical protein